MDNTVKNRAIEFVKHKGITMKAFESKCGLSTGYITSMRKGFGADKLKNVLTAFPDLNRDWLLYGEGEMIKDNVSQISHGDNSPNISGNGNNVNAASTIDKALNEIAEQRKLVAKAQDQVSVAQSQVTAAMEQVSKSQQQIDRLLSILETTNNV